MLVSIDEIWAGLVSMVWKKSLLVKTPFQISHFMTVDIAKLNNGFKWQESINLITGL